MKIIWICRNCQRVIQTNVFSIGEFRGTDKPDLMKNLSRMEAKQDLFHNWNAIGVVGK